MAAIIRGALSTVNPIVNQKEGAWEGAVSARQRVVEAIERRTDQEDIVDWRADLDLAFGREAGGQAHHLCAVRLHWEIAQRTGIRFLADVNAPAEDSVQRAGEHGGVERGIRPAPERPIGGAVGQQQIARDNTRLPNAQSQAVGTHPVQDSQSALLEQLPLLAVRRLGGFGRDGVRLFGEGKIGIA